MLPTNVMSFMKKMVTNETVPGSDPADSGNTLSKLRQTLSSSLMNAQDKVTKLTPVRQNIQPETTVTPTEEKPEEPPPQPPKTQPKDPGRRAGTCRVCLKSFKPEEFFKMCSECQQKVCEDCASYSKLNENQDESTWSCSICRRKRQSRTQPVIAQDSTESLLDVPMLEALQRRHSDVKLGPGGAGNAATGLGAGLAPPRSPELRRHSDVSPASLKEIEKVAGDRREELRWERELEWRKKGSSAAPSQSTSPTTERRPFPDESSTRHGPGEIAAKEDEEDPQMSKGVRSRRKSRIGRQHSYDDEIKSAGSSQSPSLEPGLGLPVALPRRASAYDVYAFRQGEGFDSRTAPGGPGQIGALPPNAGRRQSFRVAPKADDPQGYEPPAPASPEGASLPALQVEEDRRTRRRGSQLPDISNIRALQQTVQSKTPPRVNPEALINSEMRRQPSCDGEAIKIVIDDVDSDTAFVPRPGSKRRVVLRKDPADKAHRSRGFGMRVVGGKASIDGRLFAYIVWTVPGGPAEKAGLQQGDKVLEWCGVSLIDRSFEEVCSVLDRTGDVAELLVEHANDLRMCDLLDDPGGVTMPTSRKSSNAESLGLTLDSETDKAPSSPTRRKLPKTPVKKLPKNGETSLHRALICPHGGDSEITVELIGVNEQIAREKQVSGRIQIQVFYNDERKELSVAVLAADDLACHEDTGYGALPEAYAQLRLLPASPDQHSIKTDVWEPTQNPMWNATLEFSNVPGEDLMERTIEVTLWDYCPDKDPIFLGECSVDLQKALLDDRPVWYRLEDPKQMRLGGISPYVSPRGSLANEIAMRLMRRSDFALSRSISDDRESEGSQEFNLLHPDHAWLTSGSRRGSSQSEGHLETDAVYQLGQDYSRSLPGSRRSSFQSQQGDAKDVEGPPPQVYVNRGRRRSSVVRQAPEEILRSLKACKGDMLGRQMSLTGNEKRASVSYRRASCQPTTRLEMTAQSPFADLVNSDGPDGDEDKSDIDPAVTLGPGQIRPKGHRGKLSHGEVKLGLLMTKGQLEVEVVCARNIVGVSKDSPPDTYIKTYLKDNDRWLQKRKTKVVSHNAEPTFRQTLRYSACDVFGRSLLVMLWERQKGFEHNQGLGGAELALDKLQLTQLTIASLRLNAIERARAFQVLEDPSEQLFLLPSPLEYSHSHLPPPSGVKIQFHFPV